jgi:hypothetical protein
MDDFYRQTLGKISVIRCPPTNTVISNFVDPSQDHPSIDPPKKIPAKRGFSS